MFGIQEGQIGEGQQKNLEKTHCCFHEGNDYS